MPLPLQGDIAERPSPAPNEIRTRANAAAATAPAAMAAHETAACASTIVDAGRSDSILSISRNGTEPRCLIIQLSAKSSMSSSGCQMALEADLAADAPRIVHLS